MSISELKRVRNIQKIYIQSPINVCPLSDVADSITQYKFKIFSSNGQSVYYYYPIPNEMFKEFSEFQIDIRAAESCEFRRATFYS